MGNGNGWCLFVCLFVYVQWVMGECMGEAETVMGFDVIEVMG